MRFSHLLETTCGLTLVALSLIATPASAQTVISDETLLSSTFVVNKQDATAKCGTNSCRAMTSMFAPITVTCPPNGAQTCTFHISLDTKASTNYAGDTFGTGPVGFYVFLVDGVAPTIGPTDKNGYYLFERGAYTSGENDSLYTDRQSYPASVFAGVTNSSSNSHVIVVKIGCLDAFDSGGCEATAHWSTMRVDVFVP